MNFGDESIVTTDLKHLKQGGIFVDISEGKNKSGIYKAYEKGAALIFTTKCIIDSSLPVIRVKDSSEALLRLLDTYNKKLSEQVRLIAVGGNSQKEVIADMIDSMLFSKVKAQYSFHRIVEKSTDESRITEQIYLLMKQMLNLGYDKITLPIDLTSSYKNIISRFSIDFGILAGFECIDIIGKSKHDLSFVTEMLLKVPENKPVLINTDDPIAVDFAGRNKKAMFISYGLGKKTAVTATSINIDDSMEFNYCLQRTMVSNKGVKLEPFEMPIKLGLSGEENLYNALAAITCALYYDIDIDFIKKVLAGYSGMRRRFQTIHKGDYTIIDNFCSLPSDFDSVFRNTQMMNYNRLHPIISFDKCIDIKAVEKSMGIIVEWGRIMNFKEIIYINNQSNKSSGILRKVKKCLEDGGLKYYISSSFHDAMNLLSGRLSLNDLILVLGGDEIEPSLAYLNQIRTVN
ncbi:MAG: Mur ligase family protein [Bacillota bacterium]